MYKFYLEYIRLKLNFFNLIVYLIINLFIYLFIT